MNQPLPPPPASPGKLTNDPVRWTWVLVTFVNSIIAVLLVAEAIDLRMGGILVGISAALYAAISALFVAPNTVAIAPLNELARATEHQP